MNVQNIVHNLTQFSLQSNKGEKSSNTQTYFIYKMHMFIKFCFLYTSIFKQMQYYGIIAVREGINVREFLDIP